MKKVISLHFVLLACLLALQSFGQDKDTREQLAVQYFQEEEYEKALPIFEELFNNDPSSTYLYEYYLNTLVNLQQYDDAENMLKKQVRKRSNPQRYQVDLGHIYELQNEKDEAEETYDEVIENLPSKEDQIQIVANTFKNYGKTSYAIQTYQKAREILNSPNQFSAQLAKLYRSDGQYEAMFKEYLTWLEQDSDAQDRIQKELQELVMQPDPYGTFKNLLLSEIQNNPGKAKYIEMLSWLFIQNKDFKSAFMQLRALDQRLEKDLGKRLLNLADVCIKNQAYGIAENLYGYIVNKGEANPFYPNAKKGQLDVQYNRITEHGNYDSQDVKDLVTSYQDFMESDAFNYSEWGEVVLRLSEMKAVYQDQVNDAIKLLENMINSGADESLIAKAKIDLGDYAILKGDLWDATLYYSQVEKMFKNHPLGNKAKFRNAKLSFYKGEFDWAQAQLKVLAGASSKLISNDAIQLRMLIKDNRGLDTTEVPLKMYARADFHIFKNNYDRANKTLDSILSKFPEHNLTDEIFYAKARMHFNRQNYDSAASYFKKVHENHGDDILGDDALFRTAEIHHYNLNNQQKAQNLYEQILLKHKGSVYKIEARKRFRKLRGDKIN